MYVCPRGFSGSVGHEEPSSRDRVCRHLFWSLRPPLSNRLWSEIPDAWHDGRQKRVVFKERVDLSVNTRRLCWDADKDLSAVSVCSVENVSSVLLQCLFVWTGKLQSSSCSNRIWDKHSFAFYFDNFLQICLNYALNLNGNPASVTRSQLSGNL